MPSAPAQQRASHSGGGSWETISGTGSVTSVRSRNSDGPRIYGNRRCRSVPSLWETVPLPRRARSEDTYFLPHPSPSPRASPAPSEHHDSGDRPRVTGDRRCRSEPSPGEEVSTRVTRRAKSEGASVEMPRSRGNPSSSSGTTRSFFSLNSPYRSFESSEGPNEVNEGSCCGRFFRVIRAACCPRAKEGDNLEESGPWSGCEEVVEAPRLSRAERRAAKEQAKARKQAQEEARIAEAPMLQQRYEEHMARGSAWHELMALPLNPRPQA